MSRITAIAAFALFAALLSTDRGLAQTTTTLTWTICGGRLECSTATVPLDYADPEGRQIQIALIRQPARDPSNRVGSLLVDPGGPGGSGVDFVRGWAGRLSSDIQDRFDIVGFDPRGIGASTPALECHDNIQQLAALPPSPATPAEWTKVEQGTQAFAALCAARGGDLLPHLGSLDVVRDMDRIRQGLGEQTISYFGYSYGTVLGALYADQFPSHLRAVVLDGPVDLTLSSDEVARTQAIAFEQELNQYLDNCRSTGCALASGGGDPASAVDRLIAAATAHPIPSANADRPAGPGETLLAIIVSMYGPGSWPSLTRAIQQGLDGDGTALVRLADRYLDRSGNTYSNSSEMNAAVNCLDYATDRDPAHYIALAQQFAVDAPHFGASNAEGGLFCAYWAATPRPIGTPHAPDAPPLLIVGATRDPATPLPWAIDMRLELGTSVLLERDGDGHTSYASGNECIDSAVNAYLLNLKLPQDGALCGADGDPRPPVALAARGTPLSQPVAHVTSTPAGPRLTVRWPVIGAIAVLSVAVAGPLWWLRHAKRI